VAVRRVIAGMGRSLIFFGVLILLFVAYQLWGTGLSEARSQHRLKSQFNRAITSTTSTTVDPNTPVTAAPPSPEGDAIAIIKIPKIGIEKAVVEGVGTEDLKKGPGHYPTTPMPGQKGNAAIAGHRTTYGHPFYDLDQLKTGDPILITTRQGKFRYEVFESKNVSPNAVQVLDNTPDNRLTLTTCTPRYSAAQRLVVVSHLIGPALDAPPPSPAKPATLAKAGLSGKQAPKAPAVEWGLVCALVLFGTWYVSRRWRRWPAYLIGTPVFLFLLFFFFENVSRLMPANI
jgi:sortase A